jgi:hypothetical protein
MKEENLRTGLFSLNNEISIIDYRENEDIKKYGDLLQFFKIKFYDFLDPMDRQPFNLKFENGIELELERHFDGEYKDKLNVFYQKELIEFKRSKNMVSFTPTIKTYQNKTETELLKMLCVKLRNDREKLESTLNNTKATFKSFYEMFSELPKFYKANHKDSPEFSAISIALYSSTKIERKK